MRTLKVEISDEQLALMENCAGRRGITMPDLVVELIDSLAEPKPSNGDADNERVEDDPLWQIAGVINTKTPDLSARHDEYLSQSYSETHDHE